MKKKKIMVWILTLVMVVMMIPTSVFAKDLQVSSGTRMAFTSQLLPDVSIETVHKSVRYDLLKAGSRSISVLRVKGSHSTLSFDKVEGAKYFKVIKNTGKIVIGKGTPVGEYSVKIKVKANSSFWYRGFSKTVSVKISVTPGIQLLRVTPNHKTVQFSKVKSGSVTLKNVLNIEGSVGKVTYKKVSGTDYISVNSKTGAVTVKKNTPKSTGTYRIGIKVTAAGNKNYRSASKSVTLHVTVQ